MNLVPMLAPTLQAGGNETGGTRPPGTTVDTAESLVVMPALTARYGKGTDSDATDAMVVSALTSSGVGTCGADDNQAQAGHLVLSIAENQRGEVIASPMVGALSQGGGKPGQGYPLIAETLRSHPRPGSNTRGALVAVTATGETTHTLTSEGADASEDGTGRGTPVVAFAWQAGGNNDASGAFSEEMSPTLPKSQTMAVQTETTVRRLTPLECERLQGFPDGHTVTSNGKPQADSARYRQMGNAVAVPCVEWIAHRLVAVDGGHRPERHDCTCADCYNAAMVGGR